MVRRWSLGQCFFILFMLSRAKKEQLVEELSRVVHDNPSIVFTDFTGLATSEIDELKEDLRSQKGQYRVVKKSLLPFIAQKTGIDLNLKDHQGSLAFAYADQAGVEAARTIGKFTKSHEKLIILGGLLNRVFAGPEKIRELAALPLREELLGKLMYLLNPAGSLVRILASPLAGLVNVISNIKK